MGFAEGEGGESHFLWQIDSLSRSRTPNVNSRELLFQEFHVGHLQRLFWPYKKNPEAEITSGHSGRI